MIELYFSATPNGWKASVMLEECGLPYKINPIDIGKGDQFTPEYKNINPNSKIPAIVDTDVLDEQGQPIALFESGAILLYLAQKTNKMMPNSALEQHKVVQWLFWQVGGLGPMMGQHGHFKLYAPDQIDYAITRYNREVHRLFGVLDNQLKHHDYVVGSHYSIADIACFPWIQLYRAQEIDLSQYPQLLRWYTQLKARPALRRGMSLGRDSFRKRPQDDPEANKNLFGNE